MTGLLNPVQHHDLHEAPHVQAVGGRVKTDIGRDHTTRGFRIQAFQVGALVQEATRCQRLDQF